MYVYKYVIMNILYCAAEHAHNKTTTRYIHYCKFLLRRLALDSVLTNSTCLRVTATL